VQQQNSKPQSEVPLRAPRQQPLIEELIALRKANRWTLKDVSDRSNGAFAPHSLGSWERYEKSPSLFYLTAWAGVFNRHLTLTEHA